MFTSLLIENFRGFRRLSLESLKRVNLFSGMNNAGKTALLEAIFLHLGCNNPELALRVNTFRGMERFGLEAEQVWGWLFYEKNLRSAITLNSIAVDAIERRLKITVQQEPGALTPSSREEEILKTYAPVSTQMGFPSLVLEYSDSTGVQSVSKGILMPSSLRFEPSDVAIKSIPGVFLASRLLTLREDAERFSKLTELGLEGEILPTLRLLEPRLKRLVLLVSGGAPIIHGDIGIGRLIPVNMMGEGLARLLSLLLTVYTTNNGCVLIDEIENGLHYSVMQRVWKALIGAAETADTQIFSTTHSRECIMAAHRAIGQFDQYDFNLQRLERIDGDVAVIGYDREMLDTADEFAMEVR
jgi:hypothetical protein